MPHSVLNAIMDRTAEGMWSRTPVTRTTDDGNICVLHVFHLFGFFTHGFSQYLDELFHSNVLVAVIVYGVGPVIHMSSTVAKSHCSISLMI